MLRLAVFSLLSLVMLGCLPYSPVEHAKPPLEVPEKYAGNEAAKNAGLRWWRTFEDPQLTSLVERALTGNFDVMIAWARLERAQAVATAAGAPLWPSLSAYATGGQRVPFPGFTVESIEVGAQAQYELDLFGRNLTAAKAAGLEAVNARDNVEVAAITVSAETAQAYFNLLFSALQAKLLEQQAETNEEYLELIELRFEKGLAASLDVYQQRDRVIATQQALIEAKLTQTTAALALAQLLGVTPGELRNIEVPEDLEPPPPLPEDGLSSNLLVTRPDVRAARRTVTIADQRVGIAIAEYLPRLNLSGQLFFQSNELGLTYTRTGEDADGNPVVVGEDNMFENLLYAFSVGLQQNIFDGFAREARIDENEAIVRESLMTFGRTMLTAIVEAETAIASEENQRQLVEALEKRVEQNANTMREARARYERGLSDFLPVLTAQTTTQNAEIALLNAKLVLLQRRVQLHRALGGTWTRKLAQPTWVEPQDGEEPKVPPAEDIDPKQ